MSTFSGFAEPPEVIARPATFPQFDGSPPAPAVTPINLMLDVAVTVSAELGKASIPLGEVLKLGPGSIVQLDRLVSEPVDVLVKGILLARGEVVVVDDFFAIKIKEVIQPRQTAGGK